MDLLSRFLLAAAAAATLFSMPVAEAADKAADKARATAPAPAPKKDAIMTQAQLRECLSQKETLDQRNAGALKAKSDIVAMKAELDRTAAENSAAQATLDRTKKDEVDAFNAKIVARNALVEEYQAKAETYNKEVEDIHAVQESYTTSCSNKRYDDRDLADIQRKK